MTRVNHDYRGLFSIRKGDDGGTSEVGHAQDSRGIAAQGRGAQ